MHSLIQALLALLPRDAGRAAVAFAVVGAVAGVLLWIAGARFSRYLVTLAAVAIGTGVGVGLPRWMGWGIDHMAPAVGGAVVLGVSAYVMHRAWIGLWFGILLAIWAAVGTWMVFAANQNWDWPSPSGMTVPAYLRQVWDALPPDVAHALPMVCAAAFVIGAIPAMVWPRAGAAILYSALGSTLVAITGTMLVNAKEPKWLAKVPPQTSQQLTAMALVVLLGAGLQWQLYFRKPAKPVGPSAPRNAE